MGGYFLTVVRTAAPLIVSIARLACKYAKVQGMVGAGHQTTFQQRGFEGVVARNPYPEMPTRQDKVAQSISMVWP